MLKKILIDAVYPEESRVVILENNKVQHLDYESSARRTIKGNIYLAKITRVEPSLQAAFIEWGGDRHGFLPFDEIHPNYYNIPVEDRADANEAINLPSITPPQLTNDHDDDVVIPESANEAEEEGSDSDLDEDEFDSNKNRELHNKYKIQEVIKKNQVVLVQAVKEERGNKGATFTTYLSFAGRYCVLMVNSDKQGGVSRRIANHEDRKRLKSIIESLETPANISIIIRTAGAGKTKGEIKRDYDYLVRLWNGIRESTLNSKAPSFIHAESDLIKRTMRDTLDSDTAEINIQGLEAYQRARDFVSKINPNLANKVKHYKHKAPIFSKYNIEEQLSGLYSNIATLTSGGYVVFNHTEALVAIDVNSGKATSERNIEETATKTNVEAATEIARQIRLRDLSGLIVIDFIDMIDSSNRRMVERTLKEALQRDRARIQVGFISNFGLLEMSRQRLRSSFIESHTTPCIHCKGRGFIRNESANSMLILRMIENEIVDNKYNKVHVYCHPDVIVSLLNHHSNGLSKIKERHKVVIDFSFEENSELPKDAFSIEGIFDKNRAHEEEPNMVADDYYPEFLEEETEKESVVSGALASEKPDFPKRNNHNRRKFINGKPQGKFNHNNNHRHNKNPNNNKPQGGDNNAANSAQKTEIKPIGSILKRFINKIIG